MTISKKPIKNSNKSDVCIPTHAPQPRTQWAEHIARTKHITPRLLQDTGILSDWDTTAYDGIEEKY